MTYEEYHDAVMEGWSSGSTTEDDLDLQPMNERSEYYV